MVSYSEIYNVNSTALPLKKTEFGNVFNKKTLIGYYPCAYTNLVTTLKEISTASELKVSLNPGWLFNTTNNPVSSCECLIQVEGMQTYDEFINKIIQNEDNNEWSTFTTYSPTFKDEIKDVKLNAYKKFLWKPDNIENWMSDKKVSLPNFKKNEILTNFDIFTNEILYTGDYESFVNSCNSEDKQKCIEWMVKQGIAKLVKYGDELTRHVYNNNKREEQINVKNPLIMRIYIMNTYSSRCRKDFPKIKFTTLDKKNFDSISLWDV